MGRRVAYENPESKVCRKCLVEKTSTEFYTKSPKGTTGPRRLDCWCKPCRIKYVVTHKSQRLAVVRDRKRKWMQERGRFVTRDLTLRKNNDRQQAYDLQLLAQHGACAVCLRTPAINEFRFAFDHDHTTGLARGILCSACNGGLGCFRDDPKLLLAAVSYLRQWSEFHGSLVSSNG